jgi:hypothetical protein
VIRPSIDDPNLAYETGFHLGDGNLAEYRYALSGNRMTELEFYRADLIPLIRDLYHVTPHLSTYGNSVYAVVYSKDLVQFKTEVLGLPIGRKKSLRLPAVICSRGKESMSQVLSGLYDADGSAKERRTVSGIYPRISIAQKFKEIIV